MANVALSFGAGLALQLIGGALSPPQRIGKLENRSLPDGSFGSRIPKGYGTFPIRGILVAAPEEYTETQTRRGKIGGKTIEFTYSATLGFLLARNQIKSVVQLKLNGDQEIDFLSQDPQELRSSTTFYGNLTLNDGSESQTFDPDLNQINSPNIAYRGSPMLVFPNLDLTENYGNRPPLTEALISTTSELVSTPLSSVDTMPTEWVAVTTGTVDTPINDVWVATAGTAEHSGGVGAETFLKGPIDLQPGEYVEVVFGAGAEIGVSTSDTPPFSTLIRLNGGDIEFGNAPNIETITAQSDCNSLRIQRGRPSGTGFTGVLSQIDTDKYFFFINGVNPTGWESVAGSGSIYIVAELSQGRVYSTRGEISTENALRAELELINLADVLSDICDSVGLASDTSEIRDQIQGIDLTGDSPKEWIEQLQQIFGFFVIDQGNQLKFLDGERPAPVRTFSTLDDFGTINQRPYAWEQRHLSELPYEVEVSYYNVPLEQEASEYSRLDAQAPDEVPSTTNKIQIQTGATMEPDEAKGIADMHLARIYMQRETYTLTTTVKNADLEPGDVISLPYLGEQQEFLIHQLDLGANFVLELGAYRYDRSPWQLKRTPTLTSVGTQPTISQDPALLFLQTLPPIETTHPPDSIYWGASQSLPPWSSCALAASADAGASFVQVSGRNRSATIGVSIGSLPASTSDTVDFGVTLLVRISGELDTITQASFDGGNHANWLVIGDEIIKFRTANLITTQGQTRYYILSQIKRGLGGTMATEKAKYQQIGLASTLTPISRSALGATGETIQFQLFLDGAEQANKVPYSLQLP